MNFGEEYGGRIESNWDQNHIILKRSGSISGKQPQSIQWKYQLYVSKIKQTFISSRSGMYFEQEKPSVWRESEIQTLRW